MSTSPEIDEKAMQWRHERLRGRGMLLVPESWCVPSTDATMIAWSVVLLHGAEHVVIPDPWAPGPDAFVLAPMPDPFALPLVPSGVGFGW
jgi:hypothetical protein